MPTARKPRQSKHDILDWEPAKFLTGSNTSFILLVLNQPIEDREFFIALSRRAHYIVCADGGANRVKDLNLSKEEEYCCGVLYICGDLDSLRPDVRKYYEDTGTTVVEDPDQYSTDITKCLKQIKKVEESLAPSSDEQDDYQDSTMPPMGSCDIAMIGGLGGRADQAFSQLHHLYTANETGLEGCHIYLITSESIIFLLEKGINRIYTPTGPGLLAENVGIIPLGRPSTITTRGLEWDVKKWQTEFGTQISTSNHIRRGKITIDTSEKVLFTVEIARASSEERNIRPAKRRRIESNEAGNSRQSSSDLSVMIGGPICANPKPNDKTNGSVSVAPNDNITSRVNRLERLISTISTVLNKVPSKLNRHERLIKSLNEEVSILAKHNDDLFE